VTLQRDKILAKMSTIPVPRRLPEILNSDEVARFMAAIKQPKYRAALSIAYGSGCEQVEVVSNPNSLNYKTSF